MANANKAAPTDAPTALAAGPRRSWLHRAGRLIAVAAAVLLVLELLLRLFWHGYYLDSFHPCRVRSPILGWEGRPLADVRTGKAEYVMRHRHNSLGWRDREYPAHKPAGTYRVLVLGDSFAYGSGAEGHQIFSEVMEARFRDTEIINAGMVGYGSGQELLLLEHKGLALEPDLVLVMFLWNDISDNCLGSVRFQVVDGQLTHTVIARPDADEGADEKGWLRQHVLRYSYLYRFGSDHLKYWRARLRQWLGLGVPPRLDPRQQQEAWQIQEAVLQRMQTACRRRGARLIVALIPDYSQVHPGVGYTNLPAEDIDVQARMMDLCRRLEIEVVDLLPGMREADRTTREPLYYLVDWHWTPAGHRAAADLLTDYLIQHVAPLRERWQGDGPATPARRGPSSAGTAAFSTGGYR